MIKINPKLKNNPMINEETLPLLFQKNYDTGTYEQVKDFDWNWDCCYKGQFYWAKFEEFKGEN